MNQKTKFDDRIRNCLPSQRPEDDWTGDAASSIGLIGAAADRPDGAIPVEVDLRRDWWDVGDQMDTGSCVGWATADSVLRWMFVENNVIGASRHLSVRYVWMASKETDEFVQRPTTFIEVSGTSPKAALDVVRKYGVVFEEDLPFETMGRLFRGKTEAFYAKASRLRYIAYYNLGRDAALRREWLAKVGPILTRLDCDHAFMTSDGRLETYDPSQLYGGHAVCLAGYDTEGFLVRNSWGATWGDGGYARATEAYAADAFTEAYGVWVPRLAEPIG